MILEGQKYEAQLPFYERRQIMHIIYSFRLLRHIAVQELFQIPVEEGTIDRIGGCLREWSCLILDVSLC